MRNQELITATELAERLRLKPETIRLWAREGRIPALRPTAKTLRFDLNNVLFALGCSHPEGKEPA